MITLPLRNLFRRRVAPRVICVLGMHRSGTSCLAGSLESWGVFLGDVWRQNAHNAKGSRESRAIMTLHDAVLAANGGSWFNPPSGAEWNGEQRRELGQIITSFDQHSCWGFKDPRTLFVLDAWQEALPGLEFIGIFRHPIAVARSLQARDSVRFPDLIDGVKLWTQYNRRLLEFRATTEFPIVSFDADGDELSAKLESLRQQLRLPKPQDSGTFFDSTLRHHATADEGAELPEETLAVWRELRRFGG